MSFPAQLVSPSIQHEPDLADAVMDLHLIAEEALKKDYPEEGDFPDREMMQRVLSEPDAGADLIQGLLEKTRDAVDNLLSVAIDEDGLDREFPHSLREFVREHGLYGVLELATALGKHHNSEVVEETLIHLGAIEDDLTLEVRLSLLQQFLRSTDVGFRDAAGLGIAAMDEPSAIEDLREVIQSETAPRLRRNFNQIIEQLERTLECQVSGG